MTVDTQEREIEALRARVRGMVARPGEPGYELSIPWDKAVQLRPSAVVAVADSRDVAETVRFAGANGYRVAVQCTGHGAVTIDGEDVLLIHTGRLEELHVDPTTRRARVGAGLLWQPVLDAAAEHELAPVAGSSTQVGAVGFLTGGGIGPLVRTFGAGSDWVRGLDVVTGDGELRHVTAEQGRELFWGLRGGKGTLGVVCAVDIELAACAEVYGGAIYYDGADAAAVVHRWSEWIQHLPEHANTSIALLQLPPLPSVPPALAGRLTVAVRFTSTEPATVCEPLLGDVRGAAPPLLDAVTTIPYDRIAAVHADPTEPMPTSQASALLRELPDPAIETLLSFAGPGSRSPQTIVELRLLGGAYGRPPVEADAVSHRDAAVNLTVIGAPGPHSSQQIAGHAEAILEGLEPWATGGVLANFAASADPASIRRRYDDATLVRLSALGDRYDPAGVFRVGQVVRGL